MPVVGEVPAVAEVEILRGVARDVAKGILHQFGVGTLSVLGP